MCFLITSNDSLLYIIGSKVSSSSSDKRWMTSDTLLCVTICGASVGGDETSG